MAHSQKSTYKQICFYSPEYKRHLAVISFIGGYNVAQRGTGEDAWKEDLEKQRLSIIYDSKTISAYINKTQWQDPTYGTKANPMPIFFKRALSGFECAGGVEDYIYIKPSVYKKFVELYLAHGLKDFISYIKNNYFHLKDFDKIIQIQYDRYQEGVEIESHRMSGE